MIVKHLLIFVIAHCGGMPTGSDYTATSNNSTPFTECSTESTQVSSSTHSCYTTPLTTTSRRVQFAVHEIVVPSLHGNYLYSKILKLDKGVYAAYIRKEKSNTEIRTNLTSALMISMTGPKGHLII